MIIFVYGADTFRSRIYLSKMVEKFRADRDPSGYNVSVLDAEDKEDGDKIISEILAMPFLATRRLIVIKNLLASKLTDLKEEIAGRIEKKTLPESNVVVIWEAADDFKLKDSKELFTLLLKEKYKEHFGALSASEISAWVAQEIKSRGGTVSSAALAYLTTQAGHDLWLMNSLIEELTAYKNGAEIGIGDIKKFAEEKADDNIFNLVDAIVGKQPKLVFRMIREQYKKGEDCQFIFAMLARQFKILLQIRDLFLREDNLSSDTVAKKLGVHSFVVKKSLPLVKRYSMADLTGIYRRILDLDKNIKTGRGEPEALLDILVAKICLT